MEENLSPEDVARCLRLLEKLVDNRLLLGELPLDQRKALLMAAGRVSRPERLEISRVTKLHRRRRKRKLIDQDRTARAMSGIRLARQATVFVPPTRTETANPPESPRLNHPRQCYVCKARFDHLHFFYDSMCRACGDLNYEKRFQAARLDGCVALITGARLKIGYQAAVRLLQCGARVVVTTRFPRDAAVRFSREPDFSHWASRLHVHGLDLRHSPSVELFCSYVEKRWDRLDLLINNAAQTVRRPPSFYTHLMDLETRPLLELDTKARLLLSDHETLLQRLASHPLCKAGAKGSDTGLDVVGDPKPGIGIRQSAALAQMAYRLGDFHYDSELFPQGKLDADLQQVDLRPRNTWRLRLGEVSTAEMLEVHLINSVAPFILCGRLRGLMTRDFTGEKHIINVSAMEGSFSRHTKTDKHPHTNMAKAALNMLTLTSAPDLAQHGIYMNAVDTGWVTDEDPLHFCQNKRQEHDFHPPLDIVDGAARVLDPIFTQRLGSDAVWGKFFKDYRTTAW